MENKRGWIRIVEAVVALLLITGVLLTVIGGEYIRKDISEKVYDSELTVLREISRNQEMRGSIVEITLDNIPLAWENFGSNGLSDVETKIKERMPSYLECVARVCVLDRACEAEGLPDKSIYARSIAITATNNEYSPKQLKLFCWEKT